jgi:glycosyltransferase involved in cell wall biosynthesis
MNAAPLISFIIPFYKRFALLKEALQSVFSGGFDDIEIILVDDASCENGDSEGLAELKELLEFTGKYENIIYVRQERNLGPGAARNLGLTLAKGEWIFFMDGDDVIYGDVLPELAAFLKNPQRRDTDIVFLNEVMLRYQDSRLKKIQFFAKDGESTDIWLDKHFLKFTHGVDNGWGVWHYFYRRTFLLQHDIKCVEAYHMEDVSITLSAACYAKKISIFPHCFYEYRVSSPLSLVAMKFENNTKIFIDGRRLFFKNFSELCESDIPDDRKIRVEHLLYRFILYSRWEPEAYKNSAAVRRALEKLRANIARYTEDWRKKVYASPCLFEAAALAKLLNEWGGGGMLGFIDKNNTSERALSCARESGCNVYNISDIPSFEGSVILIFGVHADEIGRDFEKHGLIENRNFVKTGLI